jgi:hypothetical protein
MGDEQQGPLVVAVQRYNSPLRHEQQQLLLLIAYALDKFTLLS